MIYNLFRKHFENNNLNNFENGKCLKSNVGTADWKPQWKTEKHFSVPGCGS